MGREGALVRKETQEKPTHYQEDPGGRGLSLSRHIGPGIFVIGIYLVKYYLRHVYKYFFK